LYFPDSFDSLGSSPGNGAASPPGENALWLQQGTRQTASQTAREHDAFGHQCTEPVTTLVKRRLRPSSGLD